MDTNAEIERLTTELGRAYRALHGFANARRKGELLNDTAFSYHAPTVGAAARFVREQSLEGADYFVGKPIAVLRAALVD